MERGALSVSGQLTFGLLLALAVYGILVFLFAVAQVAGGPNLATAYVAMVFVGVNVFLLPLVWWGNRWGFLGAVPYGLAGAASNLAAPFGAFGPLAPESLLTVVSFVIINLAASGAGWMAWKG